jgi:NDP-sugar pyrophosphorylase family protein
MAGRGRRFSEVGYTTPKPFIDVKGWPMIKHAIYDIIDRNPSASFSTFIFLCLQNFLDQYGTDFENILKDERLNYKILPVKEVTEGAACTVLLAKDLINNDEELIITDCDHIVEDPGYVGRGLQYFRKHKAHGGMWCFVSSDPKWSYVDVYGGRVCYVAEKNVISDIANTGTYYFSKGNIFVKYAEQMIQKNRRSKGEFYVAPVYNELNSSNYKVIPFMVNDFVSLGTPEDLEKYLNGNI